MPIKICEFFLLSQPMSSFSYSCLLGKVLIHFLYVPRLFDISSGLQLSRYPPRLLHEEHIRHEPGHYWPQIPLPETENTIIINGKFTLLLKRFSMGRLWHINILTWIQAFGPKFLLCQNSYKRLQNKQNTSTYRSLSSKPRRHVRILIRSGFQLRVVKPKPNQLQARLLRRWRDNAQNASFPNSLDPSPSRATGQ